MEPFDEANDIFVERTVRRNLAVETFLIFGKFLLAPTLDGMNRVGVNLLDSNVTGVGFC